MKKLIISLTWLALSCATESTPETAVQNITDPCQGKQWLENHELNCGPGKFYCLPKVENVNGDGCRLYCGQESYPIELVEVRADRDSITIRHDQFSVETTLCLVR